MEIKAIFFDLDGTLYFKGEAIDGAIETVNKLRNKGYICRFLTNTDSKTPAEILYKLEKMGFEISLDEIFTPVTASVKFLQWNKKLTVYPLVSDNIIDEYKNFNIDINAVDYVVIGDCRDKVSYEELNKVFKLINENTEILALQKAKYFYDDSGRNLDTGAFVAMMEYSTGKIAKVLGKPSEYFFNILLKDLDLKAEQVLIIGDDITTDIVGANIIGAKSALVRTGKYNDQKNIRAATADNIIDSIFDLGKILQEEILCLSQEHP